MSDETMQARYNTVPYPNLSHAHTHPDLLATIATLLGMQPTPVEHCRVLELGCAGAGNLLAMADELPESEFVGIDYSMPHVEQAHAAIAALGLPNVTVKYANILDVDAEYGQFDYIIAHGIYSWVPPTVREKVLEICRQNLSPQGIAYISYNTFPGWHNILMAREIMLYHTRQLTDPQERVNEALRLADFLVDASAQTQNDAYAAFWNAYRRLRPKSSANLGELEFTTVLYDELADFNTPFYFHEFAESAALHGLQYLAEAEFATVLATNLPQEILQRVRKMAKNDLVEMEQYLDFVRNRFFRRTLLCHDNVTLDRALKPERLRNLYVASTAQTVETEPGADNSATERFRGADGALFASDHPITKAAFHHLIDISPRALSFASLFSTACAQLGIVTPTEQDAPILAAGLLQSYCYSPNLIELHVHAPTFVTEVSERPVASRIARYQAESTGLVTNRRHLRVDLRGITQPLLLCLDGQHDRAALLKILTKMVKNGQITLDDDQHAANPRKYREMLPQEVEESLQWLAKAALLVG